MAQKIQYTIDINADSSAAKKTLNELNKVLTDLGKFSISSDFLLQPEIEKASDSALKLQKHLQDAVNVNTGKLDISKLMSSLKQAGTSVTELVNNFSILGSEGQVAANKIALAISQAEIPIKKTNTTLSNMMTTLKNTVKWELSSTMVHGLESALSGAITYAKDLNSSLNDIRIVTGQSTNDMAKFTVEANKAAKALSTTTKSYADAALIYYQQGDSNAQVAQKAAITIKAANASFNTSASEMSEYLTAVWNSYQVGADQMEHYVDIMASLGAKTATSLEEIATAMQKVAATGNAVGVSMESVSSIIATVSSVTRESAESIGTSYKTIFARIGDLKLGKTDEDGVGLGTVSSQLQNIGVDILSANGELRDMEDIITDLGDKWQTMGTATKTAVAQAVAGKRQYTQLMALFENWDMYKQNMDIAENSDGSLNKMAQTYSESWEAVSKKLQATFEELYSTLIDDKAIINFTKSMTKVVQAITDVTKGLGGLPGIIATVAAIITTKFQNQIAGSINTTIGKLQDFKNSFKNISKTVDENGNKTGHGKIWSFFNQNTAQRQYQQTTNETRTMLADSASGLGKNTVAEQQNIAIQKIIESKQKLLSITNQLTPAQEAYFSSLLDNANAASGSIDSLIMKYEQMNESQKINLNSFNLLQTKTEALQNYSNMHKEEKIDTNQDASNWMQRRITDSWNNQASNYGDGTKTINDLFNNNFTTKVEAANVSLSTLVTRYSELNAASIHTTQINEAFGTELQNIGNSGKISATVIESLKSKLEGLKGSFEKKNMSTDQIDLWLQKLNEIDPKSDGAKAALQDLKNSINDFSGTLTNNANTSLQFLANGLGLSREQLTQVATAAGLSEEQLMQLSQQIIKLKTNVDMANGGMNSFSKNIGKSISKVISGFSSALSSFTSMASAMENWDESSITSKISSIGNTFISAASQFASGNIVGGAMSLVGAGIGYLVGQNEAEKKRQQQNYEDLVEDTNKANQKMSENLDSQNNALQTFNDLYAEKKNAAGIDEDLATAAQTLAEAYGITGVAVSNLTNNYQDLIDKIKEKQELEYATALTNVNLADQALAVQTGDKTNGFIANNRYSGSNYLTERFKSVNNFDIIAAMLEQFGEYGSSQKDLWKTFNDTQIERLNNQGITKDTDLTLLNSEQIALLGDIFKDAVSELKDSDDPYKFNNKSSTGSQVFYRIMSNLQLLGAPEEFASDYFGSNSSTGAVSFSYYGDSETSSKKYSNTELKDENGDAHTLEYYTYGGEANNEELWAQRSKFLSSFYGDTSAQFMLSDNMSASTKLEMYDTLSSWYNELMQAGGEIATSSFTQQMGNTITALEPNVEAYRQAVKYAEQLKVANISSDLLLGHNEKDTSFKDYITEYNKISNEIDQNQSSFSSLSGLEVNSEEYNKAKKDIIDSMIEESGNFSNYLRVHSALYSQLSDNNDKYNAALALLSNNTIGVDQVTQELLDAMQIEDYNNWTNDSGLVQSILKKEPAVQESTEAQTTYKTQKTNAALLSSSMSDEDIESLYDAFDWGQNGLPAWEDFVNLSFEEQKSYLQTVVDSSKQLAESTAKAAKETADNSVTEWKEARTDFLNKIIGLSGTEDTKIDSMEDAAIAYQTKMSNYEALAKNTTLQDGKYVTTDETSKEWEDFQTAKQASPDLTLEDWISDQKSNWSYDGNNNITTKIIEQWLTIISSLTAAEDDASAASKNLNLGLWDNSTALGSAADQAIRLKNALTELPTDADELSKLMKQLNITDAADLLNMSSEELAKKALKTEVPILKGAVGTTKNNGQTEEEFMNEQMEFGLNPKAATEEWKSMDWDPSAQSLADYNAELQAYNELISAAYSILSADDVANIENATSAISTLTGAYSSFYKTGKFDIKTQNALKKLGIDSSTITTIEQLDKQIKIYKDNLSGFVLDLQKMAGDKANLLTDEVAGLTWEQFASKNKMDESDGFKTIFEAWKQAYWDAKTAGEDFNSTTIKNSINVANSITKITNEITKLTEQTQKAKSVMDTLKEALTQDTPLTAAQTATLTENGFTGNWKSKPSENIGTYGASVGNWALANSAELEKQRSYNTLSRLNNRDAYDIDNRPLEVQERIRESFATGLEDAFKSTDSTVLDNWLTSQHIDDAGKKILKEIFSESGSDQYSYADILAKFKEKMKELEDEQTDVWATFDDLAVAAIQSVLDEEKSAAAETVSTWEAAYKAIAEARAGLASGKSILETLYGDKDALASVIAQYLNNGGQLGGLSGYLNSTESQVQSPTSVTDLEYGKSLNGTARFLNYNNGELSVYQSAEEQQSLARDSITKNLQAFIDGMDEKTRKQYDDAKAESGDSFDPVEYILKSLFGEGYFGDLTEGSKEYVDAMAAAEKQMIDDVSAVSANSYSNGQQEKVNAETNVSNAAQINNDNNVTSLYGKEVNYDEATALQSAIENAQTAKYNGDEWESLSAEDRTLLDSYGIDFGNVDTAAQATADALAELANAALAAAEAQAEENGYKADAEGNWYKADTEISANEYEKITDPKEQAKYSANGEGGYYETSSIDWSITDTINNAINLLNQLKIGAKDTIDNTLTTMAESIDMTKDEFKDFIQDQIELGNIMDTNTMIKQGLANSYDEALALQGEQAQMLGKIQRGFKNAIDSGTDLIKTLSKLTKGSTEWSKTMGSIKKIYKDVFSFAPKAMENLSDSFYESAENMKLLQKAAEGDEKAYADLEKAIATDLTKEITYDVTIDDSSLQDFINYVSDYDFSDLEVGATIDDADFNAKLNNMIFNSADAAQKMSDALSTMGVDARVVRHSEKVPPKSTTVVKQNGYYTWPDGNGGVKQVPLTSSIEETDGGQEYVWYTLEGAKYNGGGVTHGGSGSGGGSSGGGGGGGGGKKETKEKKKPTDEIERYHEINNSIEDLEKSLDKLSKLKDRAYGKNYVTLLQQEANAIEDQIDKQKELIDQTKEYLDLDRSNLAGEGSTFDANGNLNNYDELMQSWLDEYNAAVDKYNKGEQGDAAKELLEQAEKEYEDRKELIDKYEESHDQYLEAQNDLIEQQNELSAKKLEIIQYKVEYKIDINEDDLAILEYYQDKYDDDLDKQGEAMQNLIAQHKEYEDNLSILNNALAELNQKYQAGEITQADYQSGLADIQDQMLENLSSLEDVKDSIKELYENTLSKFDEEITNQTDKIDNAKSALESYVTLMGLMGRGKNYKELQQFYDAQYEVSLKNVEAQKAYLDALKEQQAYFENKQELTDVEKAQYEALSDSIDEVNNNLISNTQTALESVQALYENTVNIIFQELDTQMGYMDQTLSELADSYSYYTETQERYVTSSKQLYEVSKLNREIEDSIAGSTTKASKQMLKDLQAKINAQSESNRLTEYDIQMNELQYQLALKKIALEETQNAKSKVQLTRDDNGNYIYRYTADEDKMAKAQQEYEDVLQQINELAANRVSELEQSYLDAQQSYYDKAQEIALDSTLTEEERMAKLEELSRQFAETLTYTQGQYGIASSNLLESNAAVAEHYGATLQTTADQAAAGINATLAGMMQNTDEVIENWVQKFAEGGSLSEALRKFTEQVTVINGEAGTTPTELAGAIETIVGKADEAAEKTNDLANSLVSEMGEINSATEAWNAHAAAIDSTIASYENSVSTIQKMIKALADMNSELETYSATPTADNDPVTESGVTHTQDEDASNGIIQKYSEMLFGDSSTYAKTLEQQQEYASVQAKQSMTDWEDLLTNQDSGLQKSLQESIDIAMQNTLAKLNDMLTTGWAGIASKMQIDQTVTITAEFPNVEDSQQIADALETLVNRASQYASKTTKDV